MNEAIVRKPHRHILVHFRVLRAIRFPKAAKRNHTFAWQNQIGQIDNFVDIKPNVGNVAGDKFTCLRTAAEIEIESLLLFGHLRILRNVRKIGDVITRRADSSKVVSGIVYKVAVKAVSFGFGI